MANASYGGSIENWFTDRVVADGQSAVGSGVLYQDYRQWCATHGEYVESHRMLSLRLIALGYRKRHTAAGSMFIGIKLRTDPSAP